MAWTPAEYPTRVALNDCNLATLWGTTLDRHRRRHGDRRVRGWVRGKHYYIQLDCDKSNMSTLTSQLGPFSDDTEYNHRNYNFCRMPLSPKWATPGLGSDFAMSQAKHCNHPRALTASTCNLSSLHTSMAHIESSMPHITSPTWSFLMTNNLG